MTADELLRRLLESFYVSSDYRGLLGLSWSYQEYITIHDIYGIEFEKALIPFLGKEDAEKLTKAIVTQPENDDERVSKSS